MNTITLGTIRFAEIKPGNNIVMMGISDLDEARDQLPEFFLDNKITNMAPTAVYRILDNVRGNDGRTDWLVEFPENVNFNCMARLAFAQMMKWTEDFIANYHSDYYGHNSYLDEDDEPETDCDKYSLVGVDGNAYAVMGYVAQAMKECKKPHDEIDDYRKRATSGDYNNLLCVSMGMLEELNEFVRSIAR